MLEDVKFELSTLDFRALTPEQWSVLKSRLIEQARRHRNTEIRGSMARAFASPQPLLGSKSRAFRRLRHALAIARRRSAALFAGRPA